MTLTLELAYAYLGKWCNIRHTGSMGPYTHHVRILAVNPEGLQAETAFGYKLYFLYTDIDRIVVC